MVQIPLENKFKNRIMKKITSILFVATTLIIVSCRQQDEMSEIDINTLKAIEKSRAERDNLTNGSNDINSTPIKNETDGDPLPPPRK